ncbi:MAG: hypothetical protein ACKVOO_00075 [Burkholderiaceae bacterium]
MSPDLVSTIGLLICVAPALVHGPEVISPMLARWVTNWILPLYGPRLPNPRTALTRDEMLTMLDAARDAGPKGKEATSSDYIFLMLFEGRQISLASLSVAATVFYGLNLGLEARAPLHFMFSVLSVLFGLVCLNQAGIPGLGEHPRMSRHGRNAMFLFVPVWAISATFNIWAFVSAH